MKPSWESMAKWGIIIIPIMLVVLMIGILIASLGPEYEFENEVQGHIMNADRAPTPEQTIYEIELALEGIDKLGLEDDDHGAYFWWAKTSDKRVGYTKDKLLNITVRLEALIVWRDSMDRDPEEFKDVYNSKLRNIQNLLGVCCEWSDETPDSLRYVRKAFYAKNYPFLYLWVLWCSIFILIWIPWIIITKIKY